MELSRSTRFLALAAFVAFVAANLIHNRGGIDSALVPGGVFTALLLWKPRRVFQLLAAISVAVPAIAFFKWAALTDPSRQAYFVNHLFLLLAAVFAVGGFAMAIMPRRNAARTVAPQQNR